MDPGFRRDDDRGEDGVGCDDGHFFLPKKDFVSSTGVIVVVIINGRQETRSMWVEKKAKTVGDSPMKALCHGTQ